MNDSKNEPEFDFDNEDDVKRFIEMVKQTYPEFTYDRAVAMQIPNPQKYGIIMKCMSILQQCTSESDDEITAFNLECARTIASISITGSSIEFLDMPSMTYVIQNCDEMVVDPGYEPDTVTVKFLFEDGFIDYGVN